MAPPRSRGRGRRCPRLPCPCRDPRWACTYNLLPNFALPPSSTPAGSQLPQKPHLRPRAHHPASTRPASSRPNPPPRAHRPAPSRPLPPPNFHLPNSTFTSRTHLSSHAPRGTLRPGVSYRDAALAYLPQPSRPSSGRPTPSSLPGAASLSASPPRFLRNPSLRGRCFRCFGKGHRAARCRDPRRCLTCMEIGHSESRCRLLGPPRRRRLQLLSRPLRQSSCPALARRHGACPFSRVVWRGWRLGTTMLGHRRPLSLQSWRPTSEEPRATTR